MTDGLPLFDRYTKAAKEEAIARVEANANPDWLEAAYQALYRAARRLPTVTTDDVWRELGPHPPPQHERRAIGSVMDRGKDAGLIVGTDRQVPSKLGAGRWTVRVWMSAVFSIDTAIPDVTTQEEVMNAMEERTESAPEAPATETTPATPQGDGDSRPAEGTSEAPAQETKPAE